MNISKILSNSARIHQLVGIVFFLLCYVLLVTAAEPKLYWEGHQGLFRYSAEYFREMWVIMPGLFYLYEFLMQFFIFPWLGALIVVGFYVWLYAILRRLMVAVGYSAVVAHYIVLAILAIVQWQIFLPVFSFKMLIPMTIFYSAIRWYLSIKNTRWRIGIAWGLLWILPFFIGVWTLGVGLFFIVYEFKASNLKVAMGTAIGVLISIFLPPWIWHQTIFTMTYPHIAFANPVSMQSILLFTAVCGSFVLLVAALPASKIVARVKNYVGVMVFILVAGSVIFAATTTPTVRMSRLFYSIERNIERGNWEAVLDDCNAYLELTDGGRNEGPYYTWIVDNTKFALTLTGRLLDDFFSYSKYPGFGILFPQALEVPDKDHAGVYNFLSAMGLQSEAIHSAFENILTKNPNPLTLDKLIKSHIIFGDYRPCIEFVNLLDESLFFKKEARAFRQLLNDTAAIKDIPFYRDNRRIQPKYNFQTSWCIDFNMANLCLSNFDNQRAAEYLFTMKLTLKQEILVSDFDSLMVRFDFPHIPRHIEEALLIYNDYGDNPEMTREKILELNIGGLHIREKTIDRCDEFFKLLDLYNMGLAPFKTIMDRFGDTYWFHYLFIELRPIPLRGQNTYDI